MVWFGLVWLERKISGFCVICAKKKTIFALKTKCFTCDFYMLNSCFIVKLIVEMSFSI